MTTNLLVVILTLLLFTFTHIVFVLPLSMFKRGQSDTGEKRPPQAVPAVHFPSVYVSSPVNNCLIFPK